MIRWCRSEAVNIYRVAGTRSVSEGERLVRPIWIFNLMSIKVKWSLRLALNEHSPFNHYFPLDNSCFPFMSILAFDNTFHPPYIIAYCCFFAHTATASLFLRHVFTGSERSSTNGVSRCFFLAGGLINKGRAGTHVEYPVFLANFMLFAFVVWGEQMYTMKMIT